MKNNEIVVHGSIFLVSGLVSLVLSLVFMAILPTTIFGIGAVILIMIGGMLLVYSMVKPVTDDDFTDEQLRRMGRTRHGKQ